MKVMTLIGASSVLANDQETGSKQGEVVGAATDKKHVRHLTHKSKMLNAGTDYTSYISAT